MLWCGGSAAAAGELIGLEEFADALLDDVVSMVSGHTGLSHDCILHSGLGGSGFLSTLLWLAVSALWTMPSCCVLITAVATATLWRIWFSLLGTMSVAAEVDDGNMAIDMVCCCCWVVVVAQPTIIDGSSVSAIASTFISTADSQQILRAMFHPCIENVPCTLYGYMLCDEYSLLIYVYIYCIYIYIYSSQLLLHSNWLRCTLV